MTSGTVKWFDDSIGHGFIVPDAGVEDLFVKRSSVAREGDNPLVKGARVSFDRRDGTNGPEATNVTFLAVPVLAASL